MKITQGFGKRVQMVRSDLGASQHAFATKALSKGASAKNIGRIEQEQVTPRIDTLEKIAAAGNVDMQWLVTGKTVIKPTRVVKAAGIGSRVAALRTKRGLTMKELAQKARLGDSSKNVGRIETGEVRPRGETLTRLAGVLGVPVEQLAYGA